LAFCAEPEEYYIKKSPCQTVVLVYVVEVNLAVIHHAVLEAWLGLKAKFGDLGFGPLDLGHGLKTRLSIASEDRSG